MKFGKLLSFTWIPAWKPRVEGIPERFQKQVLHDTDLTVAWLLESLRKNDNVFVQKYGTRVPKMVSCHDVSDGKGLFSVVLKVKLEYENSIYFTIVKIPGTYVFDKMTTEGKSGNFEFNHEMVDNVMIPMHNNECLFYSIVAPWIPEILPRVFEAREWKFYENQVGYLHMEDLSVRGKNLDYFNCLSHGQIKNIVRHLAHFHKVILTTDEALWKGKFTKNKNLMSGLTGTFKNVYEKYKTTCKRPEWMEKIFQREDYINLICNCEFADYAYHQSYLDIGIPTLLVHGDLWTSNVMFKSDSEGKITDEVAAILDWQIAHEGNFLIDFVRLLIHSCDGDIRREIELYLPEFYIDCLNSELKTAGMKPSFTAEQFKKAYDIMFLIHSGHHAIVGPMIFSTKSTKEGEELVDDARYDRGEWRGLLIYEDAIRIMDAGDYKKWI